MENVDLKNKLEIEIIDYVLQPKKNLDDKFFTKFNTIIKEKGLLYDAIIKTYEQLYVNPKIKSEKKNFRFLSMLKFFLIKQVQYSYDIERIKSYWTHKIKEGLIDDASPDIHIITKDIDNMLGKNLLETYSSHSSDDSEDSDSNMNKTVKINFNPKLMSTNSSNKRDRFKDTSNVNKTSKVTKKMLDQIHNTVNTGTSLHNPKIIRGVNIDYTGPSLLKRESSDASTICSTKISTFDLGNARSSVMFENSEYLSMKSIIDNVHINYPTPKSVTNSLFSLEEEIENFNIYHRKSGEIYYISIDLLLKKIAIENFLVENLGSVIGFIKQYSLFIKTEVLIDKIISLYNYFESIPTDSTDNKIYPVGIIKFVNEWVLLRYLDEIRLDKKAIQKFKTFYDLILSNTETFKNFDFSKLEMIMELFDLDDEFELKYIIDRVLERKRTKNIVINADPIIPAKILDIFDVLQWSEVEIARQLSLYSHQLYSKIEYNELLGARWTKADKFQKAPNVMKTIDRFNKLSFWIVEEILSYDKKIMRGRCVDKIIKIAVECEKLGNFTDMVNITTTLGNHIVKTLYKTWSQLSSEGFESLQRLNTICSCENNYANLRAQMGKFCDSVMIPHLGPLFKELAYLEEGPKYMKNEFLINITKINSVGKAIDSFISSLNVTYTFKQLEQLTILTEPNPKSEEEMEELANKIEPKFTLRKTKLTQKRISNTDSNNFKLKPSEQEFILKSKEKMAEVVQFDDHF